MTVKQLMDKLKRIPEDYVVILDNDEMFYSGYYKATGIDVDENYKQVEIVTDHKYLWDNNKWVK